MTAIMTTHHAQSIDRGRMAIGTVNFLQSFDHLISFKIKTRFNKYVSYLIDCDSSFTSIDSLINEQALLTHVIC